MGFCAGLFGAPAAGWLSSPSARGWLAFGWRLAVVSVSQGTGPAGAQLHGLVAVCVGASRTRRQTAAIPLDIGCGIALLCWLQPWHSLPQSLALWVLSAFALPKPDFHRAAPRGDAVGYNQRRGAGWFDSAQSPGIDIPARLAPSGVG